MDILLISLIFIITIFLILSNKIIILKSKIQKLKLYEKKHNCKIIYLVDDYDFKLFDLPNLFCRDFVTTISFGQFDYFFKELLNSGKNIYLIIDCVGGNVVDSDLILTRINSLRHNKIKITAIIPDKASSAACLIALSCDEIQMNDYATLSPVDPVNKGIQIKSYLDAYYDDKDISIPFDEKVELFDNKRLYYESIKSFKKEIKKHCKKKWEKELVSMFSSGKISHHMIFPKYILKSKMKLKSISLPESIINFVDEINYLGNKSF